MGTNYYLIENCCDKCGRGENRRHIGKSSAGWCFSLRVYPDDGIRTLSDWRILLSNINHRVVDEYENEIPKSKLISTITERSWTRSKTPYGYASWDEFNRMNHATDGPNGLSRHSLDCRHCIGHGEGTWDYIVGEFS